MGDSGFGDVFPLQKLLVSSPQSARDVAKLQNILIACGRAPGFALSLDLNVAALTSIARLYSSTAREVINANESPSTRQTARAQREIVFQRPPSGNGQNSCHHSFRFSDACSRSIRVHPKLAKAG